MNGNRSRFTRRALLAGIGQVTMAVLLAACGQEVTPAATQAAVTMEPGSPQATQTTRPASTPRPTSTPQLQGEVVGGFGFEFEEQGAEKWIHVSYSCGWLSSSVSLMLALRMVCM